MENALESQSQNHISHDGLNSMREEFQEVQKFFLKLQQDICQALQEEDGLGVFENDPWERTDEGKNPSHLIGKGGGNTRVLKAGKVIEQGGVSFSQVFGDTLPAAATLQRPELAGAAFQALGISLVIHPLNPYVPTTHANLRFFLALKKGAPPCWWFGGGFDLTPYYPFREDCVHWHQTARRACDPFGPDLYPKYKRWCDEYFYLKHRNEPRGIGGLFFDDMGQGSPISSEKSEAFGQKSNHKTSFETCLSFVKSVGEHFIPAYRPIVAKRKNTEFTEEERKFQCYRRGRYVEFNLLYDRGTLFGLQSGGRIESILMSLPPKVEWQYNWQPKPGSREAKMAEEFFKVQDWVSTPLS